MISIIIPTLNEEKTLDRTLWALMAQLRTLHCAHQVEVIVSDGLSSDQTCLIASEHGCRVVFPNARDRETIAAGRNRGADAANGEILIFLDADCSFPDLEYVLGFALNLLEEDPKLLGVTAVPQVVPGAETWADWAVYQAMSRTFQFFNRLGIGMASGEFQMVRAWAFHAIGGYNQCMAAGEDNDLFWRLSREGRTRCVPSLSVLHSGRRIHEVGWPKLLWMWITNTVHWWIHGNSKYQEWKQVR
jgi:glycosyltransferase involved in cell wall biosynthesis